ncbi:MAG: ribonuclease HII [Clostridiales bacterium]|nr:ribonuclease HII [Clostridiales bacterium]
MLLNIYDELDGVTVCGVDEAGRGPLAGPVYAAAVILPKECRIDGLNDSKKLSGKKRELLYDIICESALAYGVAFATVDEIDSHNILGATYLAMQRAMDALAVPFDLALIDGNKCSGIHRPCRTVVGGDGKYTCIAAASILAKVTRDRYMTHISEQYPQYHFNIHKGYGTKKHYEYIREYGPSPIHRKSFLKKLH